MSIELTVEGTKFKASNFVAAALIKQFAQRFPNDEWYVEEKADYIYDKSAIWCILYCFNLDEEGCRIFAENLNVPVETLKATHDGLRAILG